MFDLLTAPSALGSTLRYNYAEIDPQHREEVREAAIDIRQRTKRASDDILEIGRRLSEVKELLPHGQFTDWVKEEFDLSGRTAQNLMNVAQRFLDKSETVSLLGTSVLYLLASPSVPDAAIEATVAYAQRSDEPVTKAQAQAIIAEHREPRRLTEEEVDAVVWRAIRAQKKLLRASDMLAWMATATNGDYRQVLNPGVVVDEILLERMIAKVRGELQRMAARETPPPPQRATAPVMPAKTVYVTPEPPPPPQEVVIGEIVEEGEEFEPQPPPTNRNSRLRYILSAYREALRLVPEYGDLTGCHSQGLQIRRVLEEGVKNLEGNLV